MIETFLLQLQQNPALFPHFTNMLLNDVYPLLFVQLRELNKKTGNAKIPEQPALTAIAEKMLMEMEHLVLIEKMKLFPFLNDLFLQNEKSENCKPFKNITVHHTILMQLCTEFIALLNQYKRPEIATLLVTDCIVLREQLTILNHVKQKHLFAPFKNCGACIRL